MSLLNIQTPQNKEAEFEVLGCLINNSSDPDNDIFDMVTEDDFYGLHNKAVYQAVKHLRDNNQEVNHFTVMNLLKQRKDLDGQVINSSLFGYAHYKEAAIFFINQLKQKTLERKLIEVGDKIALLGQKNEINSDKKLTKEELREKFEQLITEIDKTDNRPQEPITSEELFESVIIPDKLQDIPGITTGYKDLDYITGGWQKSNLILIAGRPGMGKTAFIINSLLTAQKKQKIKGEFLFYSLEQSKEQLAYRCISIQDDNKSILDIRRGNLTSADYKRLQTIKEDFKKLPIRWYKGKTNSYSEFERVVKKSIKKHDICAVIIDHAGQFSVEKVTNSTEEMKIIGTKLQQLCEEINLPVIALAQLNRDVENRQCKKPQLADLKYSGKLEEAAWIIIFLYRDEYYNPDDGNNGEFSVIVAKNKDGPLGEVILNFHQSTLTIYEKEDIDIELDFNN